jgi:proteic killer suppression protein
MGEFAIDLRGPYRMIFEAANEPAPRTQDGRLRTEDVTAVRILAAREDYHG